jgi:hypothetical protein
MTRKPLSPLMYLLVAGGSLILATALAVLAYGLAAWLRGW